MQEGSSYRRPRSLANTRKISVPTHVLPQDTQPAHPKSTPDHPGPDAPEALIKMYGGKLPKKSRHQTSPRNHLPADLIVNSEESQARIDGTGNVIVSSNQVL